MEYELYYGYIHNELQTRIDTCKDILGTRELNFRKEKLRRAYLELVKKNEINDAFYSIVHEIKTLLLLKNMGEVKISIDSQSQPGPDFTYLNKYKIECVSCTLGTGNNLTKLLDSGFQNYDGKLYDNSEIFRQIALRFTAAIEAKRVKLKKDLLDGYINEKDPLIIFLDIARFYFGFNAGEYCEKFSKILIGRGKKQIFIDSNGNQFGQASFEYIPTIKNNNESDVDVSIFSNLEYNIISAIIVFGAEIKEDYDCNNTVVFLNPLAKNQIKVRDVWELPYWKINNRFEYIPRIKGKEQKINMW